MTISATELWQALEQSAGFAVPAGSPEEMDLLLDTPFAELGYDSLALLEVTAVLGDRHELALDDEAVAGAPTPRSYLALVDAARSAAVTP